MSFEIKSKLKWNGLGAMKDFDVANLKSLTQAAILVEGKAVEIVHVKSGALKQSITRIIKKMRAFVGTPLEYAPYEEFGTRFRDPHPFLRPAFFTSIKAINTIFKMLYKAVKYVQ
jgi:HK97 gp10 family phage protein